MKIGILDYGAGNLKSVQNALDRLINPPKPPFIKGEIMEYFISDKPEALEKADKIIFPGVGHARSAMEILRAKKLDTWLKNTQKPVLGICLGMQLLFDFSEEDDTDCLGIIPGKVIKFKDGNCSDADLSRRMKIPHMGWNNLLNIKPFNGYLPDEQVKNNDLYVYFVHSYYAPISKFTVAECDYAGQSFSAIVQKDNFIGMQFHPEKSAKAGADLLLKFCNAPLK